MVSVPRLRYWFLLAAIAVVLVVAGFYFYARYRVFRAIKDVPAKLGIEVQQSTESFSLSKSEGGRTLFTIRASKAVQYKQGGRAELHDVSIVVYGRESNRFDQIYGDDFEYDPQTGNAVAKGVVHIDLEANPGAEVHPELGPPGELKNPIHLKTSGLVFNQKSGIAKTDELVEFRIPQASGSAHGATYDSKANALTLSSDIRVETTGARAMKVSARHGTITKDPRRAVLDNVQLERSGDTMSANKATLFLKDDNTLDRIVAEGDVQTSSKGETSLTTRAPRAEFFMTPKSQLRMAVMQGGVAFDSTGANDINGTAGRIVADFGSDVRLNKIRASEGVRILQRPASAPLARTAAEPHLIRAQASQKRIAKTSNDAVELTAQAMTFLVNGGRTLELAETDGPGQITVTPESPESGTATTVITAAKFTAEFKGGRLNAVHGTPDARVVQSVPGQPNRVATSNSLDAVFEKSGAISGFVQQGSFEYHEGQLGAKVSRAAWAERATYSTASQVLTLEGSPRVVDTGMTTTAQVVRLNRRTGNAEAQTSVKTTYSELKPQPNGALLASSDPVHITASKMFLERSTGLARYTGGARLWQGPNIVEAPSIVFNRENRKMDAQGTSNQPVSTVLVEQGENGSVTPVNVSAAHLSYTDQQRTVRFEGGVTMRTGDGTVRADHVTVFLKAAGSTTSAKAAMPSATPSQLDRIVAEGHVILQQPNRRGTGDKLVYTAEDGKFFMTGGPPRIFDATQGTVTGASLTFYSHDDRVLVEGEGTTRAVTTTRVSK